MANPVRTRASRSLRLARHSIPTAESSLERSNVHSNGGASTQTPELSHGGRRDDGVFQRVTAIVSVALALAALGFTACSVREQTRATNDQVSTNREARDAADRRYAARLSYFEEPPGGPPRQYILNNRTPSPVRVLLHDGEGSYEPIDSGTDLRECSRNVGGAEHQQVVGTFETEQNLKYRICAGNSPPPVVLVLDPCSSTSISKAMFVESQKRDDYAYTRTGDFHTAIFVDPLGLTWAAFPARPLYPYEPEPTASEWFQPHEYGPREVLRTSREVGGITKELSDCAESS
jgi:hypothetical protein